MLPLVLSAARTTADALGSATRQRPRSTVQLLRLSFGVYLYSGRIEDRFGSAGVAAPTAATAEDFLFYTPNTAPVPYVELEPSQDG